MSSITLFQRDKYTFICIHLGSIVFWFDAYTHSELTPLANILNVVHRVSDIKFHGIFAHGLITHILSYSTACVCVAMVVSFTYKTKPRERKMQNWQFYSNVSPSRVPLPFVLKCNTNNIKSNLPYTLRIVHHPPTYNSKPAKKKRSEKKSVK